MAISLVNRWAPAAEKSKFVTNSFAGVMLGTVITFPMSGLIMEYLSWTWVFHITRSGNL